MEEIKPSIKEKRKLRTISDSILEEVNEVADKYDIDAVSRLVGSSGRGTWISGDRDIDIFILLPKEYDRKEFEEKGLVIVKEVAEKARSYREDYAEHPYITARFDEFDVDLVPAYRVDGASEVTSAVDRTPLHDDYVSRKLNDDLRDGIRLLKKFMKSIGVYGAELKVKGFSGYLTELLLLNYAKKNQNGIEAFKEVLKATKNWKKEQKIDLEGHGENKEFKDPLIVIDPVDPDRNVAAALSLEQWSKFIAASNHFLKNPKKSFFKKTKKKDFDKKELIQTAKSRKTKLIGIEFDKPDLVDDTLYPQLYKTEKWIKNLLKNYNFNLTRSSVYSDDKKALVLFEIWNNLPKVEKHFGPPVTSQKHSEKFLQKYLKKEKDLFTGPYIEEDRWIVERKRNHTTPTNLIKEKIKKEDKTGIGKNLKNVQKKILKEKKLFKDRYIDFLGQFFSKKPNWLE